MFIPLIPLHITYTIYSTIIVLHTYSTYSGYYILTPWKELVEKIVEEAGKRWRREERKRLQKKRNKRTDELP